MKYILIVYLFYQSGLTVELAAVVTNKARITREQCDVAEREQTKLLPLQPGNDARWQYAKCVQIES